MCYLHEKIPMSTNLKAGTQAPDFTLKNDQGQDVTLSELLKTHRVVLYFYPKDNTPGCTIEAKTFRDSYEDFAASGAQVVGVSADSAENHCGFREKYGLPFILLTDPGWNVAMQYGIAKTWGFMPGRETFIIDKDGTVLHTFRSQFNAKAHVNEALEVLQAMD